MPELTTVEDARALVLERATPLDAETVEIAHAAGRVLADPAAAPVDLPPFPSSAMDGYALRAADTPGTLEIAFRVAAGSPASTSLPAGSAAAIATGAVVPEGADAVVPVEQAVEDDGQVRIESRASAGAHVRPRGGDVLAGGTVVDAGTRLGAWHVGALAAAGVARVVCGRRPRVAVLATGSELRPPGSTLRPGEIFESNGLLLATTLAGAGAEVDVLPAVADDEAAHREAVARGLDHDVLVTSGGVSMGPHDLVRRVAGGLGVEEVFWGVAVKPGKPLAFGVRDRTLIFGLPGNPVSSLVGALLFVVPAVLALQGAADPGPSFEVGRLGAPLVRSAHRDEFVRALRRREADGTVLEPVSGQESHMIVRAAAADALVHVPRGSGEMPAESPARYLALA